jgi:hypothetical protein
VRRIEVGFGRKSEKAVAMPPLIVWAFGVIGAAVVARWAVAQGRRLRQELERGGSSARSEGDRVVALKRDPVTGIYRPQ